MNIDLHSHTRFSDGQLSPADLLAHATQAGVSMLAITDHDSIDAFRALDSASLPFRLIPGIEFSSQWLKTDVHVLGLNVDPDSAALKAGIKQQQQNRADRAVRIAERLARELRIPNPLAAVRQLAHSDYNIGRPHFARFLMDAGLVSDDRQAYKKYLGTGKPAWVRPEWATLEQSVQWIQAAGGQAILAHPARYKMTSTKLNRLVDSFVAVGGQGLEVVSGHQTADVTAHLAKLCDKRGLLASCGSDFHGPDQLWSRLGQCLPLPRSCRPVWEGWI